MPTNDDYRSVSSGISELKQVAPNEVAGRYKELSYAREELLERAREMAAVTIPSIFPPQDVTEGEALGTPFQAVGARAVNNLSNKLLLTLFPVSSPFFKLEVSEGILLQIKEQDQESIKQDIEAKLSQHEQVIQSDMEVNAFRTKFFETIRSLVVAGNFLLNIPSEGEPKGYRLDKYVVKRSNKGTTLEIIVEESISFEELPMNWKDQISKSIPETSGSVVEEGGKRDPKINRYKMYTRVYLDGKVYKEAKYINGLLLDGSEAQYPKNASAWMPLRWNGLSGEDYGRSYVEEYMSDLLGLEALSRAILEHSAIASKTFGILNPNSSMSPRDLVSVPNGGFVVGDPNDLVYPEVGKSRDMSIAQTMFDNLTDSVSRAFLITQVRDSERTTAEEIRLLASELETALGGAYSLLATTFQQPVLARQIDRLTKARQLPKINDKDFKPRVIVGLEGLGRGTDLDKLLKASQALQQLAPSMDLLHNVDLGRTNKFIFNAVGLDPQEIMKTPQQLQAEAKAQQAAQAQQTATGLMEKAVGGAAGPIATGAIENPEGTMNAIQGVQNAVQQQQG